MDDPRPRGQVAFEAYRDGMFYKTKLGKLKWQDLAEGLQKAWDGCAEAVLKHAGGNVVPRGEQDGGES